MLLIAVAGLQSCQNDVEILNDTSKYYLSSGVVVAPDAVIWSGSSTYTNTFNDNKFGVTRGTSETRDTDQRFGNSEVEVHLSLQSNNIMTGSKKFELSDLTSILSVYVRYPKDVEVIIPVPEEIYCDQDAAYNQLGDYKFVYGGEKVSYSNLIAEKVVTLSIEYVATAEDGFTNPNAIHLEGYGSFTGGYIRIYTTGIDEDVLNYCKDYFDDYLNFKVYNYYHRGDRYVTGDYATIDKFALQKQFLDRSIINFNWQQTDVASKVYPFQFVNAISADGAGNPIDTECTVWIMGDNDVRTDDNGLFDHPDQQLRNGTKVVWNDTDTEDEDVERNHFNDPTQGNHYNNSPFNWIYTLKEPK